MSDVDRGIETAERASAERAAAALVAAGRRRWRLARSALASAGAAFEREMEAGRGFLWLPVLFGIGVLGYFALPAEPSLLALVAVTAALASLAWALRRRVAAGRVAVALVMIVAGATIMTLRTVVVAAPVLPREMTVEVTGWVAEREASARGGARVRIAVDGIAGVAPERTPEAVRITIRAGAEDIRVGDADHGPRPAPAAERTGDAGRLRFRPRRLLRRDRRGRLRLWRGEGRRDRAAAAGDRAPQASGRSPRDHPPPDHRRRFPATPARSPRRW